MFSRVEAEHRLWHRGADVFNVLEKVFLFRWFGSGRVSVWLERTEGRADAKSEDARLIVDTTCRRVNQMLIMASTSQLAMEGAPCMMLHSIQTLHAECQMGSVRTVGLRVPQDFFHFRGSELRWPQ